MKKLLFTLLFVPTLLAAQTVDLSADRRGGAAPSTDTYSATVGYDHVNLGYDVLHISADSHNDQQARAGVGFDVGQFVLGARGSLSTNVSLDSLPTRDRTPEVFSQWSVAGNARVSNLFGEASYDRYLNNVNVIESKIGIKHTVGQLTAGVFGQYTKVQNTSMFGDTPFGAGAFFGSDKFRAYGKFTTEYIDLPSQVAQVGLVGLSGNLISTKSFRFNVGAEAGKREIQTINNGQAFYRVYTGVKFTL